MTAFCLVVPPVSADPSSAQALISKAHQKNLAADPYWRLLLHDRRNLRGVYQSEIDDPSFFLSPRGRQDPEAELDATLEAFAKPSALAGVDGSNQPAPCRFPARFAWLNEKLQFDPAQLPAVDCPRFQKWKDQMNPASLSLVFASYYMNNPASTYGHTFLRLNAKNHASNERLLDYVVNFAADLEKDNGLLFAVKGLMGGYHGRFSTFPYYMKVQEYNNLESRDLWEYNLTAPPAQLERLLEHLWELGETRLPYYFFNKNCSYYLLPVLDVMDPSLSASSPFVLKAIPIDTIRQVIAAPGLLDSLSYRPSHATKMIAARNRLTAQEIRMAEKLAVMPRRHPGENRGPVDGLGAGPPDNRRPGAPKVWRAGFRRHDDVELTALSPDRQALVLDSAYDLFRYKVGFRRDQTAAAQEKEQELLLLRNQIKTSSPSATTPMADGNDGMAVRPDLGHKTGRMDLGYGFSNHSHFEELSLRPALHSQDDPVAGYLPGSQLEMFHLKIRYDNDRKTAYIQDFSLVDLISITPWDRWIHPLSWKIKTGIAVAGDLPRDPENSLYYGLTLGSGYAAWIPGTEKNALAYGMAEFSTQVGSAFHDDIRAGGGPAGGILFMPCRYWRARFQASHDAYAVGGTAPTTKLSVEQSVAMTKSMEARVQLQRQNQYKEVMISWIWYL